MFPIIMKTFLRLFPILAVLRSGNSLACERCHKDGARCSGWRQECGRFLKTCVVILVENTNEGHPQLRSIKGCENIDVCNEPLQSLNMGQGRYERARVVCCVGIYCKSAAPRFQPGFIKPNGRQCPACFARSRSECGSAKVDCSGNEYYCIEAEQLILKGFIIETVYKRGCATRTLCYKPGGSYAIYYFRQENPKPNCTLA